MKMANSESSDEMSLAHSMSDEEFIYEHHDEFGDGAEVDEMWPNENIDMDLPSLSGADDIPSLNSFTPRVHTVIPSIGENVALPHRATRFNSTQLVNLETTLDKNLKAQFGIRQQEP